MVCGRRLKYRNRGIPFFNINHIFDRPHDYGEVFADNCHINERGNKVVAEKLYEYIKENNFFKDYKYNIPTNFPTVHQYGIISGRWGVLSAHIKRSLSSISRSSGRSAPLSAA